MDNVGTWFLLLQNVHQAMGRLFGIVALFSLISLSIGNLRAQEDSRLNNTLKEMPEDVANEFAQPLVDAFGANLNTGWMGDAPDAALTQLDFKLGVVFMGAFIDSDEQVFQLLDILFPFQQEQAEFLASQVQGYNGPPDSLIQAILDTKIPSEVSGPTFFGSEDESVQVTTKQTTISVEGEDVVIPSTTITLDDVRGIIADPGIFPTAAPQLTVGTVYGTQASVRYLPNISLSDDIGDLKYFGFGIQHNPAVWFANPLPVNVSLGFFTQKLEIEGDVLETTTTAYGINVSKKFGGFIASVTPYAGFLIENSNMKVDYEYEISPGVTIPIEFDLDGSNETRFILGAGGSVFGVNLFADYNFSTVNTLNITLQYSF